VKASREDSRVVAFRDKQKKRHVDILKNPINRLKEKNAKMRRNANVQKKHVVNLKKTIEKQDKAIEAITMDKTNLISEVNALQAVITEIRARRLIS